MASEKTLTAILSGKGTLQKTLEGISDSAEDVGEHLMDAAESASACSKAFSKADDEGEDLSDTLSGMADNAAVSSQSLDAVEEAAEEAQSAFWGATSAVVANTSELKDNAAAALEAAVAQRALASSVDAAGDEAAESAVEFAAYDSVSSLPGLDIDAPDKTITQTIKRVLSVPETDLDFSEQIEESIQSAISDFDEAEEESRSFLSVIKSIGESLKDWPDIESRLPQSLSVPLHLNIKGKPLRRLRGTVGDISGPTIGIQGGDEDFDFPGPTPVISIGSLVPDFEDIIKSGSRAADVLGEVAEGVGLLTGTLRQMKGIGKLVGLLAGLGGLSGTASALVGGLAAFAGIGTIVAGVIDLIAALGGLATATLGLGAAVASVLLVGVYKKGQKINKQSKEIKSAWEGAAKWISSFGDEAKQALQPIFSLPTGDFIAGFIRGGLNVLGDWSTMVKRLFPDISAMFGRLGQTWSQHQPEFFMQLEKTIRAFLPMIEGFIAWFIKSAPDALKFMRGMGTKLLPDLIEMFQAMWGAISPFLPAGAAFMSILMDLTTIFFELISPISEILGFALTPLFQGLAWILDIVADGVIWVSDAFSGLMDIVNEFFAAVANLNSKKVGQMIMALSMTIFNGIIFVFEMITNAVLVGIQGLYSFVFSLIKKIPGAKTALKAANATRKLMGKKPIDGKLNMPKVDFSGFMVDVNPKKPGKQTGFGTGKKGKKKKKKRRGGNPYGDTLIFNFEINGKTDMTTSQWKRAVEKAYQKSQRQKRLANSSLTG